MTAKTNSSFSKSEILQGIGATMAVGTIGVKSNMFSTSILGAGAGSIGGLLAGRCAPS